MFPSRVIITLAVLPFNILAIAAVNDVSIHEFKNHQLSARGCGRFGCKVTGYSLPSVRSLYGNQEIITLDRSWESEVLFKSIIGAKDGDKNIKTETAYTAALSVKCTKCYVKGTASAQLLSESGFNLTLAISTLEQEISGEFNNFTDTVVDYIGDSISNVTQNVISDGFDLDDFDIPAIDANFDIDIPEIPESELVITFKEFELYMELDTTLALAATHMINIFTSQSMFGVAQGDNLLLGCVLTLDLILDAQAHIEFESGFHIQMEDGVTINLPLFSEKLSSITLGGASFEFLPITLKNAGASFSAILRIGIKNGLKLSSASSLPSRLNFGSGIEAGVFFDVIHMKANISTDDLSLLDQASNILNDDCDIYLAADYAMNIGAKAGAFAEILDERFGPEMEIATPIYTTTFASLCARSRSTPAVTVASPTLDARQFGNDDTSEMTTTYTATRCLQSGLINCPASLRSIKRATDVVTLTAITIDGVAVFTTPRPTSFVTPVTFGGNVHTIPASTGSPVSYIAKETSTTSAGGFFGGGGGTAGAGDVINELRHHTPDNKLAIGLGLGLGLPCLIGIIVGVVFLWKRKQAKQAAASTYMEPTYSTQPGGSDYFFGSITATKKVAEVEVVEYAQTPLEEDARISEDSRRR